MLSSILQSYALPLEEEEQAPTVKLFAHSRVLPGLAWSELNTVEGLTTGQQGWPGPKMPWHFRDFVVSCGDTEILGQSYIEVQIFCSETSIIARTYFQWRGGLGL